MDSMARRWAVLASMLAVASLIAIVAVGCGDSSADNPDASPTNGANRPSDVLNADPGPPVGRPSFGVRKCSGVIVGSNLSNWRQQAIVAGRVGVPRRALDLAGEYRPGVYGFKVPVLVIGHGEVTLKVPKQLMDRVRLFYTREQNVVYHGRGDTSVRFKPCGDKPRTFFDGGIRAIGQEPVSLLVIDKGSAPRILPLGRPGTAYSG